MTTSPRRRPCSPTLLAASALLPLLSAPAWAEGNPYYLGAALTVTQDSNVRRAREGSEQSDTITAAGVRLGVDQALGRGRLVLDGSANSNRYSRAADLNHVDYALLGRLDWATVERLSGTVAVNGAQQLYRDSARADQARTVVRSEGISAQAALGVVTRLSFEAGVSASRVRYDNTLYRASDHDQKSAFGGLRFAPSPDLSLRTRLRRTDIDYPTYSSIGANTVRRNELELGTTWRPSGASTLDAQLSRARDTHSIVAGRNFDSWTGGVSWNWRASGKTGVGLSLKRESSVGSYGDYGLPGLDTGEAKLRTAVNLNTSWEATGKIRLTAGLGYARRNLDGAFSTSASQPTTDTTSTASIGMVYTLLRNVELGCSVAHENRSVGNEVSTLTYPDSDTLVRCYGEVVLR